MNMEFVVIGARAEVQLEHGVCFVVIGARTEVQREHGVCGEF